MADAEFRISDALRSLGPALQPLLRWLNSEIAREIVPSECVDDNPAAALAQHLDRVADLTERLARSVSALNSDVVAYDQAGSADVQRAVDRMTSSVGDLIADCNEARRLYATGSFAPAPPLVAGAYRHALAEVAQWLERLVRVLADPAAEIARLRQSGPPYQIDVVLRLTAPPQMAALQQWAQRQASQSSTPGLWGHLSTAILGWGLASAMLGNDCDCG